jgi:hypothetical protein
VSICVELDTVDTDPIARRYRLFPVTTKIRHAHQTTIRFSDELWRSLELAAASRDVSVAQYIRDAARERLGREESGPFGALEPPEPLRARVDEDRETVDEQQARLDEERERAIREADSSDALREQGRLARERAAKLRDDARRRRTLGGKAGVGH